jgi:hypothetical protein
LTPAAWQEPHPRKRKIIAEALLTGKGL